MIQVLLNFQCVFDSVTRQCAHAHGRYEGAGHLNHLMSQGCHY